jgi:hypothetical protein
VAVVMITVGIIMATIASAKDVVGVAIDFLKFKM